MATRAKELSDLGNSGHLNVHDDGTVTLEGGNVGIGDPTPTEGKLVVRGDANTNGLFVGGNSTTGQSYGALINAGTNSSDANFRLYDQSGSTPYLFVRGDGNVSINTATPDIFNFRIATDSILSGSDYSWPFDITRAGQTNSRGFSIGQQTGSGVTALGNHNGDMALGHTYGADSNGQPIFYETMRIKHIDQDVGRVGIGITTPTVKLDVRSSEDPSDGTIVFLRNEVAAGNGAFIRYDVNNVGDWAIGIPDNRNAFTIWKDSGNTGTEYFTVNSDGNVGIGTTSPDIYSFGGKILSVNGGTSYTNLVLAGDTNTGIAFGTSSARLGQITMDSTNGLTLYSQGTGNGQTMRLDRSGNVGIGTNNPSTKLHVNGNIRASALYQEGGDSASSSMVVSQGTSTTRASVAMWPKDHGSYPGQVHIVSHSANASADSGKIMFWDYNGSAWNANGAWDKDGKLGIGTTSPGAALDVRGSMNLRLNNGLLFFTDNNTVGATNVNGGFIGMAHNAGYHVTSNDGGFGSNANSLLIGNYHSSGGDIILATTNAGPYPSGRVIIKENGRVGIGTDNPTEKLHVAGVIRAEGYDTNSITSYNITGSYTAGTEYVFTTRSQLNGLGYGAGFYKFVVWSDSFYAGTSHYQCYTPYDEFYHNNYGSNTSTVQTINYGVSMGHAPNTGTRAIDIRLRHKYGADATYPANQTFTFIPVNGFTNLNGNAGYHLRIYLFKVG